MAVAPRQELLNSPILTISQEYSKSIIQNTFSRFFLMSPIKISLAQFPKNLTTYQMPRICWPCSQLSVSNIWITSLANMKLRHCAFPHVLIWNAAHTDDGRLSNQACLQETLKCSIALSRDSLTGKHAQKYFLLCLIHTLPHPCLFIFSA